MAGERGDPLDVLIIGGGINGCGIARDCTMRGLSVALFEKDDLGNGATWASSGMIHGGLRYLQRDPDLTRLACIDSGFIQKIAPHIIFRIPFVMPFLEGDKRARIMMELAEVYFRTYDRYAPFKGGLPHCRLSREETLALEPGLRASVLGAVTTDEWGIDAARLTLINALDARARGAELNTRTEVLDLIREGPRIVGLRVRDRMSGARREVFGRLIMGATGAWGERFNKGQGVHRMRIRPGKGIHLVYPGRLTNYAIVSQAIDGRQIFICPQQTTTIVGTTDDDYYGDLNEIPVERNEVEYLLDGVSKVFPAIHRYRIIDTTVGCRPTIHRHGPYEDDLSRHHTVYDHADEGAEGFISIAGGKLASYRVMCQDATDKILEKLGIPLPERPCRTHSEPLPGGEAFDADPAPFVELGLDAYTASRILFRHGARAHEVLALMRERPEWCRIVDRGDPVTEAELRHVIRHEVVRTLEDCRRRVRLGCGPDQGMKGALLAAHIFAEESGHSPADVPDIALHYQALRFRSRSAALSGPQLQQEALGKAWMLEAAGLWANPSRFFTPEEGA